MGPLSVNDGCERPARGGALPLQLLQSTKMMVPVHQLVPIIGAGGAECRRRCMGVLSYLCLWSFQPMMPCFEDFSTPPAASLEMTKDLSFRPSGAPCHFDRAEPLVISTERSERRNLPGVPPNSSVFRQTAAREAPFCALSRGLGCATGRNRPMAHVRRSCRAF